MSLPIGCFHERIDRDLAVLRDTVEVVVVDEDPLCARAGWIGGIVKDGDVVAVNVCLRRSVVGFDQVKRGVPVPRVIEQVPSVEVEVVAITDIALLHS